MFCDGTDEKGMKRVMYKKEFQELHKKIEETVKTGGNPEETIAKLEDILSEAAQMDSEGADYQIFTSFIQEAIGDVWLRAKKPDTAEKFYIEMTKYAKKAYDMDKEAYDYRLGMASCKRASFYRAALGCAVLSMKPKTLDEQQKKLFEITEGLYKNALACTMDKVRKGQLRYVELHARVLSEMAILHASVGNYQSAISCASDGVGLDKAIYEKMDDRQHAYHLAGRMSLMATIAGMKKEHQTAMETLEDAVFVLEEHVQEDPVNLGLMLGKNYLSLGGLYFSIPAEKEKAENAYLTGLKFMKEANEKAGDRLINDFMTSNMIVGDYYSRCGRKTEAKNYYVWSFEKAKELYQETRKPIYESMMKRLLPLV